MAGYFLPRAAVRYSRLANISRFKAAGNSYKKLVSTRKFHVLSRQLTVPVPVLSKSNKCDSSLLQNGPITNAHTNISINGLHLTCLLARDGIEGGITGMDGALDEAAEPGSEPLLSSASPTTDIPIADLPVDSTIDIFASNVGDVPLSMLGLGGYTPVGLIHHMLDFLHLTVGLPWWASIVAGTVVFRAVVFPIMIKGQVNTARLSAIKPELERLQEKLRDVSNLQNPMVKVQASQELQQLFQKHNCHPVKGLIAPLVQLPLFISFFLALRKMSYLPVESLKTGGLLWFPDLASADPYYILPVLCAASMLLTIETGGEAGMANPQMKNMKNVFRGMCVIMVPLTYAFPTAIFMYWMTSNTLSLVQVAVMKAPGVKSYFGIPETPVEFTSTPPGVKEGSFIDNFKAGYKSAKEAAMVKHSEKMKQKQYEESLGNTYRETFEYNPRQRQNEKMFEEAKRRK